MKPDSPNPSINLNAGQAQPLPVFPPGSLCPTQPVQPGTIIAKVRINPFPQRLAFSVKETAQILGVSEKTVRRLIDRKLLRASHALRHLLIPKKEIERFLDQTSDP